MTTIKFCGITRLCDALAAIDAGADMLGFNFYPPSPRSILPMDCKKITSRLSKDYSHIILVGVFVNMPNQEIAKITDDCGLQLVQLHGDEPPELLAKLPCKAYKAFRGTPSESVIKEYTNLSNNTFPKILLDAAVKDIYGGSGISADWKESAEIAKKTPILLAGGLTPGNVAEAISQVHPWGVDTASGIEESPGKKDRKKMLAFTQAVNSAHSEYFY